MGSSSEIPCPVPDCAFAGALSRVIHHVTTEDDSGHSWEGLGFQNSLQFREQYEEYLKSEPPRSQIALEAVPGIGEKRGSELRAAGYDYAKDVAHASVHELVEIRLITKDTARCIQATAKEERGYPDTFIAQLATELHVDRDQVAEAYGSLAGAIVPPAEAANTLRALFHSDDDQSVTNLTAYALRFRHFLLQSGFETIGDVAEASIDDLTEVPYIGPTRAEKIREAARNKHTGETNAVTASEPTEQNDTRPQQPSSSKTNSGSSPEKSNGEKNPASSVEPNDSSTSIPSGSSDATSETESTDSQPSEPAEIAGRYPEKLKRRDQWLLWKQTDDGRKIPRAPWETGDALRYVSAMDPENWVSFSEAKRWKAKLPFDVDLAFALTRDDDIVFLDLDDVMFDGRPSPEAQSLIDRADSHTAVSTSGTGVHIFLQGSLSDGIKALTGPIDEDGDQTLEAYDRNRFIAVTGDHLESSPVTVSSGEPLLADLEDQFASVGSETPDRATVEPQKSRDELHTIEATTEIQDLFDAIQQTRPADIRMRSTQTRAHSDGTYSYDPSWANSESGTRLGVLDDVWIYRKGMIALNALQVVALEEGIITDEREYPDGEEFWDAVEALRDRGAHIPEFETSADTFDDVAETDQTDEIDQWEVAKRINYGDRVRGYVHPYDRDYQEKLALELAPTLVEAAEALLLPPSVSYRAAELYAKGHAAGTVHGAAHESSLGAALRLASIMAETPRPLEDIAETLDETPKSIRNKYHRLMKETDLSETLNASDLIVEPTEYVPYLAQQLGIEGDQQVRESVRNLLDTVEHTGNSNPVSEVAAAFYVVLKRSHRHEMTQSDIAHAAGLSKVTIRNNYRKYT